MSVVGRRSSVVGRTLLLAGAWSVAASAQTFRAPVQHFPMTNTNAQPLSGNQPVTFQSDMVTYDKEHGLVTASGHVEAWQNDHVLRADRVTFDRNTNVVAAHGHVVIVEPRRANSVRRLCRTDRAACRNGRDDGPARPDGAEWRALPPTAPGASMASSM